MRNTTIFFTLLAAAALSGCPGNNTARDGGTGGGTDTNVPREDTGVPPEDTGTGDVDSGVPATDVSIASLVNASATDHPRDNTTVHVTGEIVALTQRFVSMSQTSGRCFATAWVGTLAGGNYSGIQVIDQYDPTAGMNCFDTPPHVIPNMHIGDAITNLTGRFTTFCPSGSVCPPNTSQQISVSIGTFTTGASAGDPTATDVTIAEVSAMGASPAPRDMALQNALVRLTDVVLVEPPVAGPAPGNFNVMAVAATGGTTPVMHIEMSDYFNVGCQRALLQTPGTAVGDITGILYFAFGQWVIHPRQTQDLPGVSCADAGTGTVDAGM